ncbi:hypothetical protein ACFWVB_39460 [Streptomyces microflavus]|uniref:hypothetical protein n=1 Tax=Streptomyces microflavus TaxID=1919 RepID=UPI0036691AC6
MDTEHEWPGALCLSRTHCVDASEETIGEFYRGTIALIDAGIPQPAFFLARQLAELSLKALLEPEQARGHDLDKLLRQLEKRGDDLFVDGRHRELVVDFIRDLARRDPGGDEGRYPTSTKGVPSLAAVCCADPVLFREYVHCLFAYTQGRMSPAGLTV